VPQKAAILPTEGLYRYLQHTPSSMEDIQDMAMAVLAYFGCLRSCELIALKNDDFERLSEGLMVKIIRTKTTNVPSRFLLPTTIANLTVSPASIFLKYYDLVCPWLVDKKQTRLWPRPTRTGFCLQFRGLNHVGTVAKRIATFLSLEPGGYTGHSFRRSSATSAADGGISLINLKRFGGWRSDSVASSYVDDSVVAAVDAANCLALTKCQNEKSFNPSPINHLSPDSRVTIQKSKQPETALIPSDKQGQFVFNITINQ
jgi:integrase